jgi:chemotaxis protein MotB
MRNVLLLLFSIVAAGCVSQGKYDDLKRKYDVAKDKLAEGRTSLSDAQGQASRLENENARARVQLEALEQERLALEAEQHRLTLALTKALEDRAKLKQSNADLERALAELAQRKAMADRRVAEFKKLVGRFKSLIDAGTLIVTISQGRMVLQLPSDVLFDTGSARLSKLGKSAVTEIATVLKEEPERSYQVEGHTDDVPIHNPQFPSNWELASARALGVVRAMTEAGMSPGMLSAASYGENRPTLSNATDEGRRGNRRIEIIIVPDLSLLPGYDELQQAIQKS